MATLPQPSLFSWTEVEHTEEIFRLRRVLEALPDQALIDALFEATLVQLLPELGRNLAIDGKAIATWDKRDPEAGDGYKSYEEPDAKGHLRKIVQHWFGYKLHLVVDADYELPLAYELTDARRRREPTPFAADRAS